MITFAATSPLEPAVPSADLSDRAVYRYLAGEVRRCLQAVPCEPDTPEARLERDNAVIAVAMTLEPRTAAEITLATKMVIADAHQSAVYAELGLCRGDRLWTSRLRAQSASLGREARGSASTLMKAQRERHWRTNLATGHDDEAGRVLHHAMTEAMAQLPPPPPLPPPLPSPGSGADPLPDQPKITRPPAPLPPSLAHLADRPDSPELAEEGPNAPPGYLPWEPGCDTPMWYTEHADNLTEEQRSLFRVWWKADQFCVLRPQQAREIRRHRGPPPDCDFELPSADVMHVLLHDNSSNFTWADQWQPVPAKYPPELADTAV